MRMIDGDALKRKAQREATEAWKMKVTAKVETILNQFIDWIENAPTIEPEPSQVARDIATIIQNEKDMRVMRKKGKWLPDNINYYEERYVCSECKISYKVDMCMGEPLWNFCPNCGADMRGGQE